MKCILLTTFFLMTLVQPAYCQEFTEISLQISWHQTQALQIILKATESRLYRMDRGGKDLDVVIARISELLPRLKKAAGWFNDQHKRKIRRIQDELECYRDLKVAMQLDDLEAFTRAVNRLKVLQGGS